MKNSKGQIYYGMHFYPGVAEYAEPNKSAFRVFLNENTIRSMGPSFAGRPVYVQHVDSVEEDIDELRKQADGWVVESFFNDADGKHWVKFLVCSEEGEKAIKRGWKLSNCYLPKTFSNGGTWNGVSYQKEITSGVYDHLAIVPNPRYEESVVMNPEEFKAYNDGKRLELQKLSNDNSNEDGKMKFFKRAKVENSSEMENVYVKLEKSGREVLVSKLINEADEAELLKGKPRVANSEDYVELDGEKVSVASLVKAYNAKKNEDDEKCENEDDMDDDDAMENEDDEGSRAKASDDEDEIEKAKNKKRKNKKTKNSFDDEYEDDDEELERRKNAKDKAKRLKNANKKPFKDDEPVFDPRAAVERGKARYG